MAFYLSESIWIVYYLIFLILQNLWYWNSGTMVLEIKYIINYQCIYISEASMKMIHSEPICLGQVSKEALVLQLLLLWSPGGLRTTDCWAPPSLEFWFGESAPEPDNLHFSPLPRACWCCRSRHRTLRTTKKTNVWKKLDLHL